MGVGGEAHIVVGVQAHILREALRGIGLALVGELGGCLAEVVVDHALHALLPHGIDAFGVALGDGAHVSLHGGKEAGEVVQAVAVGQHGVGHGALGHQTLVLQAIDGVVERAALREAGVAVGADVAVGAVHVGVAHEEALAQVDVLHLGMLLQDLTFQEGVGAVGPAGAAVVLVLDAGHGVRNHGGEDERVAARGRLLCHGGQGHACGQGQNDEFVHGYKNVLV